MAEFLWDGDKYSSSNGIQADIGYRLLASANIQQNEVILDVGCGVGNLTFALAKKASGGYVMGIDASPSMIEQCMAAKTAQKITNVHFQVQSALDITDKEVYTLIFSNSVLHWIKEAELLLQVLYAALKDRGRLLLQFPLLHSEHPLVRISNQVIQHYGLSTYYENWDFPWYIPKPKEYEALLSQIGYTDIVVNPLRTSFQYNSPQDAYNFLEAVGLKLYTEMLPEGSKDLFLMGVREELSSLEMDNRIQLSFDRILVSAMKKI